MSLLNLHYRKIVRAYFAHLLTPRLLVRFVEVHEPWFFRKVGETVTFNTRILQHIQQETRRGAVTFMDSLVVCCLFYIQRNEIKDLEATNFAALRALNAPFKDQHMKQFLNSHLGFNSETNFRHLEIADELEYYDLDE